MFYFFRIHPSRWPRQKVWPGPNSVLFNVSVTDPQGAQASHGNPKVIESILIVLVGHGKPTNTDSFYIPFQTNQFLKPFLFQNLVSFNSVMTSGSSWKALWFCFFIQTSIKVSIQVTKNPSFCLFDLVISPCTRQGSLFLPSSNKFGWSSPDLSPWQIQNSCDQVTTLTKTKPVSTNQKF